MISYSKKMRGECTIETVSTNDHFCSYANLLRMLVLSLRCQQCFHPTSVDHLSAWRIINNVISTIRNYYKGVDTFNCLEPYNCKTVHFIQAVAILLLCNPVTGDVFFDLVPGVSFQRGNKFWGSKNNLSRRELAFLAEIFITSLIAFTEKTEMSTNVRGFQYPEMMVMVASG